MKVVKQNIGMREAIYKVFGRDEDMPLVTVEKLESKISITLAQARRGLTVNEAAEFAQALLTGIQIVSDLNSGKEVENVE